MTKYSLDFEKEETTICGFTFDISRAEHEELAILEATSPEKYRERALQLITAYSDDHERTGKEHVESACVLASGELELYPEPPKDISELTTLKPFKVRATQPTYLEAEVMAANEAHAKELAAQLSSDDWKQSECQPLTVDIDSEAEAAQ